MEVEAAVRAIRQGRLPKKVRKWLIGEARWYLTDKIQPDRRRAWQKAVIHIEKARKILSGIAEQNLELLNKADYRHEKINQAVVKRFYGEDLDGLARIQQSAEDMVELSKRYPPEGSHYNNPKFMYEFKVLLIWESLGGELAVSRHPINGNIQGPLARFFRAVTVPVMGASAPSPESLPSIVQRQRKFVAFEATPDGRFARDFWSARREYHRRG